ncbi:MAG: threonine ammonia-lyase [Firmicutes bacterium]|nr:threonine ammonia-lyase [Alicyclobacillaceae bacterium]MCL6497218.1 threonine ammonia-lyase [Bacillota bacterium]
MAGIDLEAVRQAAQHLRGVVYQTPLQEFQEINDLLGGRIFFKLENLQRTGSFKIRGAYYRLCHLSEGERKAGVVAASAGNHGQGVALAADLVGTHSVVFMPEGASLPKVQATRRWGAEVRLEGETFDDAQAAALAYAEATGAAFIPAFDDPLVIAGQGTVGLELLDQRPDLGRVVVPVGGGGLIAGIAIALKERYPHLRVVGVQAEGAAAMVASRQAGHPVEIPRVHTIADGIGVRRPGRLTTEIVLRYVDDLVTVQDHDISRAILFFLERTKLVVEGAGAVGLAAFLAGKLPVEERPTAVVVSGGNIDVTLLARIIEHGLVEEGRQVRLSTVLGDRPGQLARLLRLVAEAKANVLRVEHERWSPALEPNQSEVELVLETRDRDHAEGLVAKLEEAGYDVRRRA